MMMTTTYNYFLKRKTFQWSILSCVLLLTCTLLLQSCDGFLEVDPPATQLVSESVFEDDLTAQSAMAGLYYSLSGGGFAGGSVNSVTYLVSLLGDDSRYTGTATNHIQFNTNTIVVSNQNVANIWTDAYSMVYAANLLIEKLEPAAGLSEDIRLQLTGEAYFIRAFTYFYLVNLFGDVPYTISTDYRSNTALSRLSASVVYENILSDLTYALPLLPEEYITGERVKPVKGAAMAMLARVHLYLMNWEQAESFATAVISNSTLYSLEDPEDVFLKNSREAIWQLIPGNRVENNYTYEGGTFIVTSNPSGQLIESDWVASTFEEGDLRKEHWIGLAEGDFGEAWYAFKYKENASTATGAEYSMVIRLAEMHLIRAEARAQSGDLLGAEEDLNAIRERAGLPDTPAATADELLAAILEERSHEFFFEWGHRWFDLVRTGKADEVLPAVKNGWTPEDKLLPIPEAELLVNKNLSQNPGY